jgi:uncharacterized membrane protein YhaH (DUF805 family)
MNGWYYVHNGQSFGPFDVDTLRRQRGNGTVGDETLVWTEGMASWTPYGQLPTLSLAVPPPIPYEAARNQRDHLPSAEADRRALQRDWSSAPPSLSIPPQEPARTGKRIHWYLQPFKKYAVFRGRARRREYWQFQFLNVIIVVVLIVIDANTGLSPQPGQSVLASLYELLVLLPSIAVGVRRIHDAGHSGWWLLLPIANLVFLLQDSQTGTNKYGPSPKASS